MGSSMPLRLYCWKNWLHCIIPLWFCSHEADIHYQPTKSFGGSRIHQNMDSTVTPFFHTSLLDNVHDAFHVGLGAKSFSSSING